ncbi:TolC family protein, partial [Alphaproteobacteria bacterium]|nr:TolC family protein [Alphaproteobacteria bacterium]
MISRSNRLFILLFLYLFSPFQSSVASDNPSCGSPRTDFILELIEYIDKKQISKAEHGLESQTLQDKKENLLLQLGIINFELNAQTSYTKSLNSLGSSEERDVKNTDNSVSATMAFSKEDQLKKKRTEIQIKSLEKQIVLTTLRQKQEILTNLLEIINLRYQLDNVALKLPVVESQIEYFNMLRKLGTPQIKDLTDAELEKLRINNELVNLEAKLDVEMSKLASVNGDALSLIELPSYIPIDPAERLGYCALIDPDYQIKKFALEEQRLNLELTRAQRFPQLKFELGLTSKDYHSGAHANSASIGVSLSAPLFDGGVLTSQIREAQRNYDLAQKDFVVHKQNFDKK